MLRDSTSSLAAFNTTTGPVYWELLQRARAVDNQMYVGMCSPARAESGYPAWGHSMLVDPTGKVTVELDEKEGIAFADVGELYDSQRPTAC